MQFLPLEHLTSSEFMNRVYDSIKPVLVEQLHDLCSYADDDVRFIEPKVYRVRMIPPGLLSRVTRVKWDIETEIIVRCRFDEDYGCAIESVIMVFVDYIEVSLVVYAEVGEDTRDYGKVWQDRQYTFQVNSIFSPDEIIEQIKWAVQELVSEFKAIQSEFVSNLKSLVSPYD